MFSDRLGVGNKSANHRPPFNTELSEFSRKNIRIDTAQGESKFNRDWASALIGPKFLLRASEPGDVGIRDTTFGETEKLEYERIFIRKSKMDTAMLGFSVV